ncbi:TPA: hypothetical protein OV554_003575, partial [Acinetobacter baumannii]|nr:hypothetical protein [Acinetobacter baumannii]
MQSMNIEINTEKTITSIDFAHKTTQFYDQLHQQMTDNFQELLGLLQFKVSGISSAIENLLEASQRTVKIHASLQEYFERASKDGEFTLDQSKNIASKLLATISIVGPLIQRLNTHHAQSLLPFHEKPITGDEHVHIISIEEGKSLFDAIGKAKKISDEAFAKIMGEYPEFKHIAPSLAGLKSLDVYGRMVKAKEFSEKAITEFRSQYCENMETFFQFTENFKFSVTKINEILSDLK